MIHTNSKSLVYKCAIPVYSCYAKDLQIISIYQIRMKKEKKIFGKEIQTTKAIPAWVLSE